MDSESACCRNKKQEVSVNETYGLYSSSKRSVPSVDRSSLWLRSSIWIHNKLLIDPIRDNDRLFRRRQI